MYNGYRIGGIEIYNPWSMMNYADTQELVSYWVNTSENTQRSTVPIWKSNNHGKIRNKLL